jgi:hypothetical protein
MVVRLWALCAGRPLFPGRCLVLISVRGWVDSTATGRIRSIEKSNDVIGNRTRDLPACSIALQATTLLRAPVKCFSYCLFYYTVSDDSVEWPVSSECWVGKNKMTSMKAGGKQSRTCHLLSRWSLAWLILQPWRWRRYVRPKYRLNFNGLHGGISKKIVLYVKMFGGVAEIRTGYLQNKIQALPL